jgi:hypothetical protein
MHGDNGSHVQKRAPDQQTIPLISVGEKGLPDERIDLIDTTYDVGL